MRKILTLFSVILITASLFSQSYRKSEITSWIMSEYTNSITQTNYVNNTNWSVIPFMPAPVNAVTGLEGFSDYATNGNTLSQVYVNGDTVVVAFIYGDSLEARSLNTGSSVRMSYNYSLDGGTTWNSSSRLDLSPTKSRWPEINLISPPSGRTVVGTGRVWDVSGSLRAGGACVDLTLGVGVGTVYYVPGTGQAGNTDVFSAVMQDGNLACIMQSADTLYFFKYNITTNTFSARQMLYSAFNLTNTVCSYKIAASKVGNNLTVGYVFINEPSSGGDPIRSLRVQNSTDGGTTWSAPSKVLGGGIINGDSVQTYWHEDVVYKPGTSTPYYCVPTYDYTVETNPDITRKSWKIVIQSPALNSGSPVVVADYNNIPVLQDTNSFNLVTRIRAINGVTRIAFQVNSAVLSHPTIGFSSDGNTIYCAFAVTQIDTSFEGFNFFDIWMTKSTNGGLNWSTPQNITSTPNQDEMYPVLSRSGNDGDGKVTYQSTNTPGCQGFGPTGSTNGVESNIAARVYQCFNPHPIGIENISGKVPDKFTLDQNYPNPFNPATTIKFGISRTSNVTLKVYNIVGQEVATLINNELVTPGIKAYVFKPANLSSGIYFYTLSAGDFKETRKMILVK